MINVNNLDINRLAHGQFVPSGQPVYNAAHKEKCIARGGDTQTHTLGIFSRDLADLSDKRVFSG